MIGGGIGGLATAALLARDGYTVTLLEKSDEVGGRAGSWEEGRLPLRHRPVLVPDARGVRPLLPADGHDRRRAARPGPRSTRATACSSRARTHDRSTSARPRGEPRRCSRRSSPARACGWPATSTRRAETYELAKEYFLYTTFEDLRPLLSRRRRHARCRASCACSLEPLDSFAGRTVRDPRLRQILGYPAVFLGSSPYAAPSMYHLMSHLDLDDGVLYPQGGFAG